MAKSEPPPTPECDKFAAAYEKSDTLHRFIEWLVNHQFGIYSTENEEDPIPVLSTDKLVTSFLEIDMKKVERERKLLLEWQREQQSLES